MEQDIASTHRPILGVEIAGYGIGLPSAQFDNEKLIEKYDLDSTDDWIRVHSGIGARYLADPSKGETTASLSAISGRAALEMAGLEPPYYLDSIMLATTTPDRHIPATSSTVQRLLGARRDKDRKSSARDINAACAGFGYALNDGFSHIDRGEQRSLVIGTDLLSRVIDWDDRATAILFGDGSGAVLLQKTDREEAGLLGWDERSDGELEDHLYCEHGEFLQMNGQSVYRYAIPLVAETARSALDDAGVDPAEIKLLVPHQANKRIIDRAAQKLKIPDSKVVWTGNKYANTSSASIPLALAEALDAGRAERGDLILTVGFGAGMTAAASVIRY